MATKTKKAGRWESGIEGLSRRATGMCRYTWRGVGDGTKAEIRDSRTGKTVTIDSDKVVTTLHALRVLNG